MSSKRLQSTQFGPLGIFVGTLAVLGFTACASANDTTATRGDGLAQGGTASTGGSAALSNAGQTAVAGSSAAGATGGNSATGSGTATGGSTATSAGTGGANCVASATPAAASMNAGQGCTSCHAGASPGGGVLITLGGTVFSAASGGAAVGGATVVITDSNNVVTRLVTGTDGNFYTNSTIAFPAKVAVSKCPSNTPMVSTVTSGNCNSCHGSSMQIHLP